MRWLGEIREKAQMVNYSSNNVLEVLSSMKKVVNYRKGRGEVLAYLMQVNVQTSRPVPGQWQNFSVSI